MDMCDHQYHELPFPIEPQLATFFQPIYNKYQHRSKRQKLLDDLQILDLEASASL